MPDLMQKQPEDSRSKWSKDGARLTVTQDSTSERREIEARVNLPNDVDALKAALAVERAKLREVVAERDAGAAELAVAGAEASEDLAMIAHQKLRIAKLERQLYGPHSERSARLIDQLALQFEELEASATEDELAAVPTGGQDHLYCLAAC